MLVPVIQLLQNVFLHVSDYWKFIALGGESVETLLPCSQVCGFHCRLCRGVMDWRRVT